MSQQPMQQQQQQQQYSTYPAQNQQQNGLAGPPKNISNDDLLLYIVAFFCPPLAAFWLKGGCETEVLITLVLWFLFFFPGFIYCLYLIFQAQKQREMEKGPQSGMV